MAKRVLLASNDFVLLLLAVWLAFSLRWGRVYWPDNWHLTAILLGAPALGCFFLWRLGLYRIATRFIRGKDAARMYLALGIAVLVWTLLVLMIAGTGNPELVVPRFAVLLYALLACALVRSSRWLAAWLLEGAPLPRVRAGERRPIVIYGAGPAGVRLLEALHGSNEYRPIGIIDETPSLVGQRIGGLKVYSEAKIERFVQRDAVRDVILALPDRSRRELQAIVRRLTAHSLRVKTMPSIEDIATGRVAVTDLTPIDVSDLLGRSSIPPDVDLLARAIRGKCVMVTGAGGSIGSELSRQMLRCDPRRLVLFDHSEAALYAIETEIADQLERLAPDARRPEIISVLGTVLDAAFLESTMRQYGVQTIYHAAAYKHVPIVESNAVAGLRNNTLGTAMLANAAMRSTVERVVLISTDKAVRPTSIMGASKRLAELVFQAYAAEPDCSTIFAIVRFGNVLDSSGSVVGRFRRQIEEGGPVTVTDPEVTRYFMSIPEAAALVMQAGAMARGGEVFVLDMGERVKIDDLARTMIRLMGRTIQDETNPNGDIAIRYIGLRPGEKRYEELNIDDKASETEHPGIWRNDEPLLERADLERELAKLAEALRDGRMDVIQAILARTGEGYRPATSSVPRLSTDAWPAVSRAVH
jgi:FlaA1/EpsC-like NDP-sugar epimerase